LRFRADICLPDLDLRFQDLPLTLVAGSSLPSPATRDASQHDSNTKNHNRESKHGRDEWTNCLENCSKQIAHRPCNQIRAEERERQYGDRHRHLEATDGAKQVPEQLTNCVHGNLLERSMVLGSE
jgi:hypothetical protein